MDSCWICDENERQASGHCVGAVAELTTGWVRLHRRQRYRGASFFVARSCVREVYDLEPSVRDVHLVELAEVAAAVDAVFAPRKMNIESLGNGVPHLHWWLTPRHDDDPRPHAPIWEDTDFLKEMWTESGFADEHVLARDAGRLRAELETRGLVV
ncbi:MAG TPA: HIT domain-containing protein [Acidimicrobiales bacterium]|nr:HIT domain-containing protein [Acidimicrobiales bacterium]